MGFIHSITTIAGLLNTDALPQPDASPERLDMVIGVVFGILGTIAVTVIVWGGFKYILSKGEPNEMTQAKNTIIYALVGLAVCILSYTIAAFIVKAVA